MCKLRVDTYRPRYYPWRYSYPREEHLARTQPAWRWRIRCDDLTVANGYQYQRWDRALAAGLRALPRVSRAIHGHTLGHPML